MDFTIQVRATRRRRRSNGIPHGIFLTLSLLLLLSFLPNPTNASIHVYDNQTFREVGNANLLSGGSEGIAATLSARSYIRQKMAAQVRGSAVVTAVVVIGLCMALHGGVAHATTFTVGEGDGWTFNVENWTKGKTFAADDTLVFKYDKNQHDVVVVDENRYKTCTAIGTRFSTGNDEIKLARGQYYFICSFPGHCDRGQKIAVTAN